jgi:hypothetical protein
MFVAHGKRHVTRVASDAVSSKVVNGISGRPIRKPAIAAVVAGRRLGAGGVGRRASVIGPALVARSGGVNNNDVFGSGGVNRRQRQLRGRRSA